MERTILSVLRQQYPGDVEVLISRLADDLRRKYPSIGQASLSDARGDIVAVQRGGDFYLPDAFVKSVGALVQNPPLGVVSGCEVRLQSDGRHAFTASSLCADSITPRSLMMGREISTQCAFFWRDVLKHGGGWREDRWDAGIAFWYRALHFRRAKFLPHHTAVQKMGDRGPVRDAKWLNRMQQLVESCEREPRYAERFQFSPVEKRELYNRWSLLEARQAGNEAGVAVLLDELSRGTGEETRAFLVRHGFLPKPPASAMRYPNHPAPDIHWADPDEQGIEIQRRVA